jgi:hypothetical protein
MDDNKAIPEGLSNERGNEGNPRVDHAKTSKAQN